MLQFNFNPFPTLTTERLVLRAPRPEDAAEMFAHRTDKEVNKYIQRRKAEKDVAETRAFLERIIAQIEKNDATFWIITIKKIGQFVGSISLWNLDKALHKGELGYSINTAFYNQGIMTEATGAVLDYGFKVMKLEYLEAFTHRDNIASRKVLERKGFVRDAELEAKHVGITDPETAVIYKLRNPLQST